MEYNKKRRKKVSSSPEEVKKMQKSTSDRHDEAIERDSENEEGFVSW